MIISPKRCKKTRSFMKLKCKKNDNLLQILTKISKLKPMTDNDINAQA